MITKVFNLRNIIWFCAIGLASFSGYYSVFGISKLFSGGSVSIVGMAAMLELSKLAVVTFIHRNSSSLRLSIKIYLTIAAIVLMGITSIGVYGYLTAAYQETSKSVSITQNEIMLLSSRHDLITEKRKQLDASAATKTSRLQSYDNVRFTREATYNTLLSSKRGSKSAGSSIKSLESDIKGINTDISSLEQQSRLLSDSLMTIDQSITELKNKTFSSEIGPLLYLSGLTGYSMDVVVNWFIILLVIVFDPLAVSLIIAANHFNTNRVRSGQGDSNPTTTIPDSKIDHATASLGSETTPFANKSSITPDNLLSHEQSANTETIFNTETKHLSNSNKSDILLDQLSLDQLNNDQNDQPEDQLIPDQNDQPEDQLIPDQEVDQLANSQIVNLPVHKINRAVGV